MLHVGRLDAVQVTDIFHLTIKGHKLPYTNNDIKPTCAVNMPCFLPNRHINLTQQNLSHLRAMFVRLYALFPHSEHGKVRARETERSEIKHFALCVKSE
jgi:hypothetical protein